MLCKGQTTTIWIKLGTSTQYTSDLTHKISQDTNFSHLFSNKYLIHVLCNKF